MLNYFRVSLQSKQFIAWKAFTQIYEGFILEIINFTYENIKEHNPKWPHITYHPQRLSIIGDSGSGETNALLNLIKN